RRTASSPIPPQTATVSSCSKKRKTRPECSRCLTVQSRTSGFNSRSSAATMAILGIAVCPEPLHSSPQGAFYGNNLPAQLALGLVGAGKHFLLSHPHRVNRRARLAPENSSGDCLIHYPRSKGE